VIKDERSARTLPCGHQEKQRRQTKDQRLRYKSFRFAPPLFHATVYRKSPHWKEILSGTDAAKASHRALDGAELDCPSFKPQVFDVSMPRLLIIVPKVIPI